MNHNWNGLEGDQLLISYDLRLERTKTDKLSYFPDLFYFASFKM